MKTPEQRGPFGTWLRDVRTARFDAVGLASRALKREQKYGIAASTWAELESGTRLPNDEQRDHLGAFFEASPPAIWASPAPPTDQSDVAAAIDRQTAVLTRLAEAVERLAGGGAGGGGLRTALVTAAAAKGDELAMKSLEQEALLPTGDDAPAQLQRR